MIQLTMNEKQARIIGDALEFYSRIHMGQFEEISELLPQGLFSDMNHYFQIKESLRNKLIALKPDFTRMGTPHGSLGITNKNISDDARVCYDMRQVIRHYLFQKSNPNPQGIARYQVDNDKSCQSSQERLISISSIGCSQVL